MKTRIFPALLILLLTFFLISNLSFADSPETAEKTNNDASLQENIQKQLVVIKKSIGVANKDLQAVENQIKTAKGDASKKRLEEKKTNLLKKIDDLQLQTEAAVTGGVRISDYDKKADTKKPFDLQSELLELFKPMISELKELTALPRAIEKLKSEISAVEELLPISQNAVKKINLSIQSIEDKTLLENLKKIETNWKNREEQLQNQLNLLNIQLEEKIKLSQVDSTSIPDKLKQFFSGRGLTILLALGAFALLFLILSFFGRIVEKQITQKKENQQQFFKRALRIVLQLLAILLSLFATILILYVRGDWLLLGFISLILLGIIWGLRQSAPNYVKEIKLLLNMGPVRENERVIYNDLPWKVSSLNMYTVLTNPALTGATLKLPVADIVQLRSRQFSEDEGWFPCMPEDFVSLSDGTFGPVHKQTPEIVQMKVLGGSIKTYSTTGFLGLNPRNMSKGFGVFVTFGLDYNLQDKITDQVPQTFEAELKERIKNSKYSEFLKSIGAEFKAASASSLDLLIILTFDGEAAGDCFAIERFIQKSSVEICNNNDWNIPFDNITVHLDKSE